MKKLVDIFDDLKYSGAMALDLSQEDLGQYDLNALNSDGDSALMVLLKLKYAIVGKLLKIDTKQIDYLLSNSNILHVNNAKKNALMCYFENSYAMVGLNNKQRQFLVEKTDLTQIDKLNYSCLTYALYYKKTLSVNQWKKLIKSVVNKDFEKTACLLNTISNFRNIPPLLDDYFEIFWKHVPDKDWLLNYIKQTPENVRNTLLETSVIQDYVIQRERQLLKEKTVSKKIAVHRAVLKI